MKTGVLVHGCNLNTENWRHLAWGNVPGEMGRVPQGLLAAIEFSAEVIVLGTGGSSKAYPFRGSVKTGQVLLEAEFTLAFLESHFDDLLRFKPFADACNNIDQASWQKQKDWLWERIRLDTNSYNTSTELEEAGKIFLEHNCERIILISSPTHLVRVLRDASQLFHSDSRFELFQDRLLAMPSATSYEGSTVGDVVVVEPPHRPNQNVLPTHRRIARMLELHELGQDELNEFIREFDELLQLYEDIAQNGKHDAAPSLWPELNSDWLGKFQYDTDTRN